jgi:hypothetical protein
MCVLYRHHCLLQVKHRGCYCVNISDARYGIRVLVCVSASILPILLSSLELSMAKSFELPTSQSLVAASTYPATSLEPSMAKTFELPASQSLGPRATYPATSQGVVLFSESRIGSRTSPIIFRNHSPRLLCSLLFRPSAACVCLDHK